MVVGSIQTRSWQDNNGNKRYTTEVIVDEVHFVDSKGENGEKGASAYIPQYAPQFDDSQFEDISGDEVLPF
jgi:single-strand DNA-binding protein